jgi:hypothetical protein
VDLFDRSPENFIDRRRVVHAVFDLHGVMIHFSATNRANHFGFRHVIDFLLL